MTTMLKGNVLTRSNYLCDFLTIRGVFPVKP